MRGDDVPAVGESFGPKSANCFSSENGKNFAGWTCGSHRRVAETDGLLSIGNSGLVVCLFRAPFPCARSASIFTPVWLQFLCADLGTFHYVHTYVVRKSRCDYC